MSNRLTERLVQAWQQGTLLSEAEARALAPTSFAEACRVQQAVARELGWFDQQAPSFWKLGGNAGAASAAAVPDHLVKWHTGDQPVHLCSDDAFTFTALEFELSVRLGRPLEAGATLDEARDAIAEVYLTLEVCDLRAPNAMNLPASYRLADQQMSRGFVLAGAPLEGWHETLLAQIAPRLTQNGDPLSEGTLQHPQGHPLAALPWLANLSTALYGQPLTEGSLIATGTWKGMHLLQPGDQFCAQLQGFGTVQAVLDPPVSGTTETGTLNTGTSDTKTRDTASPDSTAEIRFCTGGAQ